MLVNLSQNTIAGFSKKAYETLPEVVITSKKKKKINILFIIALIALALLAFKKKF